MTLSFASFFVPNCLAWSNKACSLAYDVAENYFVYQKIDGIQPTVQPKPSKNFSLDLFTNKSTTFRAS